MEKKLDKFLDYVKKYNANVEMYDKYVYVNIDKNGLLSVGIEKPFKVLSYHYSLNRYISPFTKRESYNTYATLTPKYLKIQLDAYNMIELDSNIIRNERLYTNVDTVIEIVDDIVNFGLNFFKTLVHEFVSRI